MKCCCCLRNVQDTIGDGKQRLKKDSMSFFDDSMVRLEEKSHISSAPKAPGCVAWLVEHVAIHHPTATTSHSRKRQSMSTRNRTTRQELRPQVAFVGIDSSTTASCCCNKSGVHRSWLGQNPSHLRPLTSRKKSSCHVKDFCVFAVDLFEAKTNGIRPALTLGCSDAFHTLTIPEHEEGCLAFQVDCVWYTCTVIPYGLASSPLLWERLSAALSRAGQSNVPARKAQSPNV